MKLRLTGLITLLVAAVTVQAASAQTSIKFEADVPQVSAELPLLKLATQPPPTELINQLLSRYQQGAKLQPVSGLSIFEKNKVKAPEGVLGVAEDEHLKSWVNLRTGDAAIYPTLSKLKPISTDDARQFAEVARQVFNSQQFISRDDTRFVVD